MPHSLMLSTAPDIAAAEKLADELVNSGAAACANIIPGVLSVYRWKGDVCRDNELVLLIKTADHRKNDVRDIIESLHPYDVPEIISFDISGGSEKYLSWISDSVRSD